MELLLRLMMGLFKRYAAESAAETAAEDSDKVFF